jgi:hypothetical protein
MAPKPLDSSAALSSSQPVAAEAKNEGTSLLGDGAPGVEKEINPIRTYVFIAFALAYAGGDIAYSTTRIMDAPDTAQGFRIGMITLFSLVNLLYLYGSFVDNTAFVDKFAVAPDETSTPAKVWAEMHPDARHAAMSQGGWFTAVNILAYGMMVFEPGSEKSMCKCLFLLMVMWQFFWYGAFLNNVDYNNGPKKTWFDYFKKETIQEIVLGTIFFVLGFILK